MKIVPQDSPKHNVWVKNWYIFTSAIGSFLFVLINFIIALIKRIPQLFMSTINNPNNLSCFPSLESMKITTELRYFAKELGLDLLEYRLTTQDGYILTLQRLINPNHSEPQRNDMPPVLLQHGLLSSSGSYLSPGLRSIAVQLLNNGFDVWLGNNRGGFEPVHLTLSGNLMHNETYWDWDIRELAYMDLPCLIDGVLLHKTSFKKLTLIGHLQGCTQSVLLLKNNHLGDVHAKIKMFVHLAPAIYPGILFYEKWFLKALGVKSHLIYKLTFGTCCFLNFITQMRNHFYDWKLFGGACVLMFQYLFNWESSKWNSNKRVRHYHFIFNVSYVSAKLMTWWVSPWRQDSFRNQLGPKSAYTVETNYSNESFSVEDENTYFPFEKQWFDQEIVPFVIFNGDKDYLVDGKRYANHMTKYEPKYTLNENLFIYQLPDYNHLDVVWGDDLMDVFGDKMITIMKQ